MKGLLFELGLTKGGQVIGVMRNNMQKVLERDDKLGDLEDKAGACVRACVRMGACVGHVDVKRMMLWGMRGRGGAGRGGAERGWSEKSELARCLGWT
jgi:hypothetical protein